MGDPEERLSDAEREQTVEWLRDHLLSGRLTLEEFSERVDQAYQARVRADLQQLRLGLPSPEELPRGRSDRRATRLTGALFGKVVKRGRIKLRCWTVAGGAFCDVDLDLRQAEIEGRRTTVTVLLALAMSTSTCRRTSTSRWAAPRSGVIGASGARTSSGEAHL